MGAAYSGEVTVHWVQSRPSDRASDVTVTVTFNQKTSPAPGTVLLAGPRADADHNALYSFSPP